MFMTSTRITFDIHYCQDHLVGISFTGKAKCCGKMQNSLPCHKSNNYQPNDQQICHHENENIVHNKNGNCCHNEQLVINKVESDVTVAKIVKIQDVQFDSTAAFTIVNFFNNNYQIDSQRFNYKPPLPDRDFLVLYQVYLI